MEEKNKGFSFSGFLNAANKSIIFKVFATAVLLYLISCAIQPNYLSGKYLSNTLVTASFLGLIAVGQTLVILTGGIDLSVVITMNLAAVITTKMQNENQLLLICVLLGVGILIGALNAVGVVFLEVPPIVMTLAMQSIVTSAMYLYTNGISEGAAPEWLRFL